MERSTESRPVNRVCEPPRRWLSLCRLLVPVLALVACPRPTPAAQPPRPNIIVILADDLGYSDLGCYGGEIRTPHLDRLASQGLRFARFYNDAKCAQTRSALLSGLYHHRTKGRLKGTRNVTIAEVLRPAGYATLMCGKWHLGRTPPERGFDRYFGFLGAAADFFTGRTFRSEENDMRLDRDVFEVPEEGFYTTDAFTDYAIQFISEAKESQRPFFLYLAHNAPHFPLQAPPEDIARYKGKYLGGWDKLRATRHARLQELGLIEPGWPLPPRDPIVPAWKTLSEAQKQEEDLLMAVYAAMVDRLDQNVGRLLDHLDRLGIADNTLVLFLSDNGACPYKFNLTPERAPGPHGAYRTYDSEWANAGNTPFRLYKQYCHEGGIGTPLIVRWPARIQRSGEITREFGHVVDILPTVLEVTGASYPGQGTGQGLPPPDGRSLLPVFDGGRMPADRILYWEFKGNRAVRQGDWKLVAERARTWELYNLSKQGTEMGNLAAVESKRRDRMAALYDVWAADVGARTNAVCEAQKPSTQPR